MKILLLEDDTFFRKFYSTKLRESGFEVEEAADGEEGLKKVKTFLPDIILLDLIMPKVDGFGVLENLSKDAKLKRIPVLVFSTLGQEKDIQRAKDLGATDYTNKSFFDYDVLLAKIKEVSTKHS